MRSDAVGKPDAHTREVAIISFLREKLEGATANEVYEMGKEALGDEVSRPAYYKTLERLVIAGKIEQREDVSVRRYYLPEQLHSANRITLDDVFEMVPFADNTRIMAKAIEAQEYFFRHRDTVIRKVGQSLANKPAIDVFFHFILHQIRLLEKDLELFEELEKDQDRSGIEFIEKRIQNQCQRLRAILYYNLSIPQKAVYVADWLGSQGLKETRTIDYDKSRLRHALERRVFGATKEETFFTFVTIESGKHAIAKKEMVISGSDGSFHAGTLNIRTGSHWVEDDSYAVTFNNSVVYVRSSEMLERSRGTKKFLYSAPLTRETMDDPAYKGMVLAPFMFPMLTESEYEHMTRAASDVVQMRVDDDILNGRARDVATGEQIIAPRVHIRDGTITPQERGFNHYRMVNPYGEIAREGIMRSQSILASIKGSKKPRIYAGAVKSTQIRLFSRIISWYICIGSKELDGQAIDAAWDDSYSNFISDVDAMTLVLASLEEAGQNQSYRHTQSGYWASCIVLRQFASLTDLYDQELKPTESWVDVIRERRRRSLDAYESKKGQLDWLTMIPEDDLENDPYVYMLENGDYASFYVGHTAGKPAPKIPRYEFLCSLREQLRDEEPDLEPAKTHIRQTVEELLTALLVCGFSTDKDHNFMTGLNLAKVVNFVVYQAHEYAKHVGKKLESEFKSMVVKRLADRRHSKINPNDVDVRPANLRQYILRWMSATRALTNNHDVDNDER